VIVNARPFRVIPGGEWRSPAPADSSIYDIYIDQIAADLVNVTAAPQLRAVSSDRCIDQGQDTLECWRAGGGEAELHGLASAPHGGQTMLHKVQGGELQAVRVNRGVVTKAGLAYLSR
jgi:hypothetical protein